jgi:hypothetical protein
MKCCWIVLVDLPKWMKLFLIIVLKIRGFNFVIIFQL